MTYKKDEVKEVELKIVEMEDESAIVILNDWRMRIYFDKSSKPSFGFVKVKYTGDIKNVHSVKFEKLK